jgi:hypothetical protein
MTFTVQNTIFGFHRAASGAIRYDKNGGPLTMAKGAWKSWLTTQGAECIRQYWSRAFLTQDFIYLPWYTTRMSALSDKTTNTDRTSTGDKKDSRKTRRDTPSKPHTSKSPRKTSPSTTATTTPGADTSTPTATFNGK